MSIEVFPLPPSGPSLAEITSAITSNAAPATVTMPAITSSITTNAASSGVTLAAIGTQVANNASPYGGTWADLGSYSTGGGNTVTFSNLGGYKYLRLFYVLQPSTTQIQYIRFNGDSGGNYASYAYVEGQDAEPGYSATEFRVIPANASRQYGLFEIYGSNNTSTNKHIAASQGAFGQSTGGFAGVWKNTAAITSLTFLCSSGNWTSVYIHLLGAN